MKNVASTGQVVSLPVARTAQPRDTRWRGLVLTTNRPARGDLLDSRRRYPE